MIKFVSKAMIECEGMYIFSIKKSPFKPYKDNKLELFGGNCDEGESPIQVLIRELNEEEITGILTNKVDKDKTKLILETVIDDKKHYIYKIKINIQEYIQMRHLDLESYGVRGLPKKNFDKSSFPSDCFTPKTVKILQQLNIISN